METPDLPWENAPVAFVRPILTRYLDPVDLIWLATARRLGLTVRRDASIFSMTDGKGLMGLGPRADLDPDDCAAQMIFHELCHWITNGLETFHERDWGFALDGLDDLREYSCQRVQAGLAERHGLRDFFGPTGFFRQYYDRIPEDVLQPLDNSEAERWICADAARRLADADEGPWTTPIQEALRATAAIRGIVRPFLPDYQSDLDTDPLPSIWARRTRSGPDAQPVDPAVAGDGSRVY
jgi:hypothetical protein